MFWNGNTARDGLSGRPCVARKKDGVVAVPPSCTRYARIGRAMFFSVCSPMSWKAMPALPRTYSSTLPETQIPPGSAMPSRRAAMLTPSPKMSPSCSTMSPTLMPTRNSSRRSARTAWLRTAMPVCSSTAQRTASTALANSTRKPSPVDFTALPWNFAKQGSMCSRR